jgi:low affinity Fe/Cu permease
MGTPWAFLGAMLIVLAWAATGPLFRYSDTWQLVINTGTTVVTFLMVFLIQNAQNRDAKAIHIKLDELIRVLEEADNKLLDVEERAAEEQEAIRTTYVELKEQASTGEGPQPSQAP